MRLQQVLDYATDPRCLPAQLCGYFGDELSQPCGQCTSCLDPAPRALPRQADVSLTEAHRKLIAALIAEGQAALQHPRQLARFLCGLSSPATFRLRKHTAYGSLAELPFRQVLDEAVRLTG